MYAPRTPHHHPITITHTDQYTDTRTHLGFRHQLVVQAALVGPGPGHGGCSVDAGTPHAVCL